MKLRRLTALLSIILLMLAFPQYGFASKNDKTTSEGKDSDNNRAAILDIMDDMTIEEKVGQLFIVHVYGKTPTDPDYEDINLRNNRGGENFKEVIENYHVGGVIYFNWTDNIGTPLDAAQVNNLSNGLQDIAMVQDNPIPLFVSTDQEGGIVQRVTSPGTVFSGNMALGATQSEEYAAQTASILGTELSSLGINMNFAPVLDVNMNPENPVIGVRSFGEDPDLVSRLGIAQITAYQDENVIASAKHFPGHGDTAVDSHTGLPIIDHDLETLHEIDLKPFKAAIDAGIDSIMTAHIVVPALDDSGLPATLSKPILTDLLREEMGYDGLIITDSLGMSGANVYPPDQVPVEAFKAGADILLNPPNVEVAYNGVLEAVQSGEISEARLDESVYRILSAKMEKGLFENPYTSLDAIENIGTDEHLQTADEIAEKSITLVKNEDAILPLQPQSGDILITGPSAAQPNLLSDLLNEKGIMTSSFATGTSPTQEQIDEAVEKAQAADKIIVTTYTANTNENQQQMVERIQAAGKPVIVAAMRNPYDLMVFPEVDAYINTYSYLGVSVHALAKAIVGDINPFGKLPVTIPGLYENGHGLEYIDTPLSANGMKTLVGQLDEAGEITGDDAAHELTLHLTAVNHYEQKELADKVVKHMEGFKLMLEQQKESEAISAKAYSYLETETVRLIEQWSNQ
ncbi:beta-N-acetylhexosaminidase [Lentibacillus populi]|uniref:beta-N-acetylhexosaminidase n=2 Tax=Lentibacillus populi TaxID=1827502 RepID=A0A9W5U1Y0_9BACI|nr:glycoside hydrolase family 3 protein [Lentibacillus populi]GGB59199.1 beta-N-acetylhexosaminidase [Lentibacillus populi]